MQYLGFGSGQDGDAVLSGTDNPTDSSASGSAASNSISATNASFAAGRYILMMQMRGSGAGNYEIVQIKTYVAGTITTTTPLVNTYTDGAGADQAQAILFPEYTSVNVSSVFTAKQWDGNVGGVIAFMCSGQLIGAQNIVGNGKGFRGGAGSNGTQGTQGESSTGIGAGSTAANGSGGGGGSGDVGNRGGGGGGGGHTNAGDTAASTGSAVGGTGGGTQGIADLTTMFMGAGGGGGARGGGVTGTGGTGGNGGAVILLFVRRISLSAGAPVSDGADGGIVSSDAGGGGGAGAAGSVRIVSEEADVGTTIVTALAATGGTTTDGNSTAGADSSEGRIRLESCSLSGTTNPTASESEGGHSWCDIGGDIY